MTAPIINTIEALEAGHKLLSYSLFLEKKDPALSERVFNLANAGISAVIPYLRDRQARVQQKHFDAVKAMVDYAAGLE